MSGVKGGPQFVQSLREVGAALDDLSATTDTVAGWLGPRIVKAAPRRTGTLAASVTVDGWGQGLTIEAGADYAAAVHARNPFVSRTIDAATAEVVEDVTKGVENALQHIKGS
jgi:hypothetical protein